MRETKTVIVGSTKPLLNYVTACITLFNDGADEIVIRARGEAINSAVEMVQLLKARFIRTMLIKSITVDGETVTAKDGRSINLPVLEITIEKQ